MKTDTSVHPVPAHPRVALLGSSGFVGTQVQAALTRRGASVVPVRAPRLESPLDSDQEFQRLSASLATVDAVVNAAGIAEPGASNNSLWAANAEVPALLAGLCRELRIRLVHLSSAAVLGDTAVLDSREVTQPFSPYSRSKAAGEDNARRWEGTVVYRPAGVHGIHRAATMMLGRLARSPLSSVAGKGSATAPQALVLNVADAVAFLATIPAQPPAIVHHPAERISTAELLTALGGHEPLHLSDKFTRIVVSATARAGRFSAPIASISRRLDVLWHGQRIASSWLETSGWTPPVGPEGWHTLGTSLQKPNQRTVVFGVTSGLSAPPFFRGLFAHLAAAGWTVNLISSPDGNVEQFLHNEGATFLHVGSVRHPSPWNDCKTLVQVIHHLRHERPEIAVWGTPKMGLLGVIASRLTHTPSIYVVHGLRYQGAHGLRRAVLKLMEAIPVALANETLTVGYDMKTCLEHDRVARKGKVQIIAQGSANGVLPATPSPTVHSDDEPTRAVFVGRLTADKGLREMLEAWRAVRQQDPLATLHLYGRREHDAEEGPLATLLAESDGVIEHGFVDDPLSVYGTAHMLLLPTRREGLPTVVLEAAAAGVPTIASNVPGAREPIQHGITGLLVEPHNTQALAQAVLKLATNPKLRGRMGDAARLHVLDRYARSSNHHFWTQKLSAYDHVNHSTIS